MSHCHGLTVASRTLESLVWARGIDPDRVFYLPNGPGIDARPNGQALPDKRADLGLTGRPVVLLYSRLFEFDVARLTDTLSQVAEAVPDLAILAVGSGLFEVDQVALGGGWARSGLADRLVDVGWVEEAELPSLLASADVGLYLMDDNLLNRAKCPVKLADMASAGLAVVGEDVGQVAEYIRHGQTGLLCPSGDTVGLAASLTELLQDEGKRRRLGAAAAAHIVAGFTWSRLAETAEQAYLSALDEV